MKIAKDDLGVKLYYVCISFNSGIYITDDDEDKESYKVCSVKNYINCIGTKSVNYFFTWKNNYTPIFVNNLVTKCDWCEYGNTEISLNNDQIIGNCMSCNNEYFLPSNDEAKEIY